MFWLQEPRGRGTTKQKRRASLFPFMDEKKEIVQFDLFGGVAYRLKYRRGENMELEAIGDEKLNPKFFGTEVKTMKIRLGDNGDTVTCSDREMANGKGKFKQFSLFLEYDKKDIEIAYLMSSDLRAISREWGLNTVAWANRVVNVYVMKEKDFFRWHIEPQESVVE